MSRSSDVLPVGSKVRMYIGALSHIEITGRVLGAGHENGTTQVRWDETGYASTVASSRLEMVEAGNAPRNRTATLL
jgi:hypothetical protein